MFVVISTSYKLLKKIPKIWYILEKSRIFASQIVSNNIINNLNS